MAWNFEEKKKACDMGKERGVLEHVRFLNGSF